MTTDGFSWGISCHLRCPISCHCRKVQVCYPSQPHTRLTCHRHTASTTTPLHGHLCPGTSRSSSSSLEHTRDTYKELHLDGNLKLSAAQLQVALQLHKHLSLWLWHPTAPATVTGLCIMVGAVPLGWLCCSRDSLCSLQICMALESLCAPAAPTAGTQCQACGRWGAQGLSDYRTDTHPGSQRRSTFISNPITKCKA